MSGTTTGFVVVTTDGTTRVVSPPPADAPDGALLELLYRELGVTIVEVVHLDGLLFADGTGDGIDMWCDEEGMLNDSPVNDLAAAIAMESGLTHQPYFGNLLFARTDEKGEAIALTAQQVEWLLVLGAPRLAI